MDMNFSPSQCKERLKAMIHAAGAYRCGVTEACPVEQAEIDRYNRWIASGANATMEYAARYGKVRNDPRQLLDGARSLIVCAFSYATAALQPAGAPRIARYALGDDYHTVLRQRLEPVAQAIRNEYGGEARICVDTAPLREHYWARRSGVGFIGRNRQLIIPGAGSYFLLATIVTTLPLPPDEPCTESCTDCGRCIKACPGHAITADSDLIDARRCLSYLTIEHRGDLPEGTRLHGNLYGCDICQRVCPHNSGTLPPALPEFEPRPELLHLTAAQVEAMTQEQFSATFRGSAIKRAKLAGLHRNLKFFCNFAENNSNHGDN